MCRTSLVFIVPQSPRVDTRIVLCNGSVDPVWIGSRDCIHQLRAHMDFSVHLLHTLLCYLRVPSGSNWGSSRSNLVKRCLHKLLLQSTQIALFVSAARPPLGAGSRLGVACRERVRKPRNASDDVIFVVRINGEDAGAWKLESALPKSYTMQKKTKKGSEGMSCATAQRPRRKPLSMWE
jgi:hypothetical protein